MNAFALIFSLAIISASSAATISEGRQLGQVCGNGTRDAFCSGTLACFRPNPNIIGANGYCVYPLGAEGDKCKGTVAPNYQTRCGQGLECNVPSSGRMGAFGTCVKVEDAPLNGYANIGESCGGGRQDSKQCAPNARCDRPARPGASGTCVEVKSSLGESCGGATRYASSCVDGLSCVTNVRLMGAKGYCLVPQ
jgi:hypothetical protein